MTANTNTNTNTTIETADADADADTTDDCTTTTRTADDSTDDATETPPSSSSSSVFTPTFDHDLIVGMHLDQAVDAIIDSALYMNVSFFVVLCCVYSREFPNRRIPLKDKDSNGDGDGESSSNSPVIGDKLVTTYDELIEYLELKSADIRRHVLPFEGRNICLYRLAL